MSWKSRALGRSSRLQTGDLQLLLTKGDLDAAEVSIVIRALNEAVTIGLLIDCSQEGWVEPGCAAKS